MKTNRKVKKIAMVFTMLLTLLAMTVSVNAASKTPKLCGTKNRYYFTAKDQKMYNKLPVYYVQKGEKIVKIKSSNKKVATISNGKFDSKEAVLLTAKSYGKTTITVWVKKGKKVYKLNRTITFHKNNPFKTVKIGNSKNFAASLNGFHGDFNVSDNFEIPEWDGLEGKLKIEMNKGWKLNSIVMMKRTYDENYDKPKYSKIKNGANIKLPVLGLEYKVLTVTYTNTKTKEKAKWDIYCMDDYE